MNALSINHNYVVTPQGDAFITLSQAARELSITYDSIQKLRQRLRLEYTELPSNGKQIMHLGPAEYSAVIAHYANKGNKYAIQLATQIMQAGMVVYLYGSAGVPLPSQVDPILAEQQRVTIAELQAKVAQIELGVQRAMKGRLVSLSKLIAEAGLNTSTPKLLLMLIQHKLVYGNATKGYRITAKGKAYGSNFPVGDSTQPRWYDDAFPALLHHINYED